MKRIVEAGAVVFKVESGIPKILLIRAKKNPANWIFPKGHIEEGETPSEAAVRETKEEAGVSGVVLSALEPVLEFQSGDEAVRVLYHLVAATAEGAPAEPRESVWLVPAQALERLTFDDARDLLRRALPQIQPGAAGGAASWSADTAFRAYLQTEFLHTGTALLQNEQDGEKRVAFLIGLATAAVAALGLVLGKETILKPDGRHPLVLTTLAALIGFGYMSVTRVVKRNVESDHLKRRLNRIRRYFVPTPGDPRREALPFDPYIEKPRELQSFWSIGTGGWLPTVIFVNAVLAGALVAVGYATGSWLRNGGVGLLAAAVSWVLLVRVANGKYRNHEQKWTKEEADRAC